MRRHQAEQTALREIVSEIGVQEEDRRAARHRYSVTRAILSPLPWTPERVAAALRRIADDEQARLTRFDPKPPMLEVTIRYRRDPKK